ncbi:MAG: hypothetical protein KAH33_01160 [Candidatus Delongbacteria bacterium]|nr:hypothetical protein [Candidatus Delongbacteria bacterium]
MILSKDFREFLKLLNLNNVKYLLVGGYAVGLHGYPRYTKDIDIWIRISPENAESITLALNQFGFGSLGLSKDDFLKEDAFVQLGYPPNRIDIIMNCSGVEFEECYKSKIVLGIDDIEINLIDLDNLRKNKLSSGRPQDLADFDNLKKK